MGKWENIQFNVYTMYNYVIPCVTALSDMTMAATGLGDVQSGISPKAPQKQ